MFIATLSIFIKVIVDGRHFTSITNVGFFKVSLVTDK